MSLPQVKCCSSRTSPAWPTAGSDVQNPWLTTPLNHPCLTLFLLYQYLWYHYSYFLWCSPQELPITPSPTSRAFETQPSPSSSLMDHVPAFPLSPPSSPLPITCFHLPVLLRKRNKDASALPRIFVQTVSWGSWVPQSVRHLTLNFASGHDLRVLRWSLTSDSALVPA